MAAVVITFEKSVIFLDKNPSSVILLFSELKHILLITRRRDEN